LGEAGRPQNDHEVLGEDSDDEDDPQEKEKKTLKEKNKVVPDVIVVEGGRIGPGGTPVGMISPSSPYFSPKIKPNSPYLVVLKSPYISPYGSSSGVYAPLLVKPSPKTFQKDPYLFPNMLEQKK
jgi:hypothetical protein